LKKSQKVEPSNRKCVLSREIFLKIFMEKKNNNPPTAFSPSPEGERAPIQIKARDEDLKGVYSNLMIITHTKEEFCLDFVNTFNPPILVSRVLMSPAHVKRMIRALEENMKKYEERFGAVEAAKEPEAPLGFQPPR